ncbi:hypothetical protein SASPL_157986 [Salvia splendens]|uniref:Major facilitator superfamily (MFS) profile domain-containing protein n=1 Tax=Salvia splendens TaxID=180675 RepID=A0A8X8YUL7_SALSN|nr:hypothetical protein SASPL_157986 [Salvia splendens]
MEASVCTVNTKSCFSLHSRGILTRSTIGVGCSLRATKRNDALRLSCGGSTSMGRTGGSIQSLFGSSAKARLVRAQASGSVVNGALEYLAKDLGIAENTVLQGKLFLINVERMCVLNPVAPICNLLLLASELPYIVDSFCLKGWIVSTLLAGATVGSFTGGSLADKFGRTKTFIWMQFHLLATAQNIETMIIGRLLAGIGIGVSSAIVPLYISEISPTEIRGTLGSVNQLFICIGILAALVAGLPLAGNPLWWRSMFGVALIPSVLLALGMAFSPESPRWLYQQGRISDAEVSIRRLYGKERVSEVMRDLAAAGQGSTEPEAGWFDLFSSRAALFLFQQLAGINAVVYYSTSVFRSAGITSDVAASALVGAANVFGTTVASSLMDKQGRKSLLLTSFAGMNEANYFMMLVLFDLSANDNKNLEQSEKSVALYHMEVIAGSCIFCSFTWKALAPYSGTLAVLGTVLYVLSFSLGAGPVPALLLPEIFSSRIRAKAVALSLGMHWISNFVIGLYFLSVVTKFGISTVYLGFASVCLLAVMYISGNVVETKGRSLEEIERALSPAV